MAKPEDLSRVPLVRGHFLSHFEAEVGVGISVPGERTVHRKSLGRSMRRMLSSLSLWTEYILRLSTDFHSGFAPSNIHNHITLAFGR